MNYTANHYHLREAAQVSLHRAHLALYNADRARLAGLRSMAAMYGNLAAQHRRNYQLRMQQSAA